MQKVNVQIWGIFLIGLGLAACGEQPSVPSTPVQSTQPAGHVDQGAELVTTAGTDAIAINTSCPISGEKVAPQGQGRKATYKGQTYGFCCDDCVDVFMANPGKYTDAQ